MKNLLTLIAVFLFTCTSVSAQSIYRNYEHQNVIQLESNFKSFGNQFSTRFFEFPTFDTYLNAELNIGTTNKITVEVPLSVTTAPDINFRGNDSNTLIGNIALGVQIRNLKSSNFLEIKLRIPTSGENLVTTSDYTERLTSNLEQTWSLESSYLINNTFGDGGYFRFKPGVKLLLFERFSNYELDLIFDASGLIGYRNDFLDINGGITTTSIISEPDLDFSDRNLSQLFTTVSYTKNNFKPGLIFRIPFDQRTFNWSIGVNLAYTFNKGASIDK